MATKNYITFSEKDPPAKTAGNDDLSRAGAYITIKGNKDYNARDSVSNYTYPRTFLGRDVPSSGQHYYYCYCVKIKVPEGQNFKYKFTLKYTNPSGRAWTGQILYGWSLTPPKEGDTRCTGNDNKPSGLDNIGIYYGATNSSPELLLNANFPDSYAGKTAYLFIWGKDDSYNCCQVTSFGATVEYTEYSSVSQPSISSLDKTRMVPGDSLVLTINPSSSGTANALTGYKIYYGSSKNAVTTAVASKKSANNKNQIIVSHTDLGSPSRGSTLYIGIQAIGTQTGYDSQISVYETQFVKINSLPSAPSITLSETKVPSNGEDQKTKITAIQSTDGDEDSLKYYYYVSSSSTLPTRPGSTSSPSWTIAKVDTEITCSKIDKYIYFIAFDGHEYSSISKISLSENAPASISIKSYSGSGYRGYDGYVYTKKISASTDALAKTYSWRYRYGESGTEFVLSNTKNPSDISLTEGTGKIYLQLTTTDDYGDSASTGWIDTGMRYANGWLSSNYTIDLTNKDGDTALGYSREMKATLTFDPMTVDDIYIAKILIILQDKSGDNNQTFGSFRIDEGFCTSTVNTTSVEVSLDLDFNKTKNCGQFDVRFIGYGINILNEQVKVLDISKAVTLYPILPQIFPNEETVQLDFSLKDNDSDTIIVNAGLEENQITSMKVWAKNGNEYYDISECVTLNLNTNNLGASELTFSNPQKIFQLCHLANDKKWVECQAYIIPVNIVGDGSNWEDPSTFVFTENNKIKLRFEALFNSIFVAKTSNSPYILPQISFYSGYDGPDWTIEGEISDKQRRINPGERIKIVHDYTISKQFNLKYEGDGAEPTEVLEENYTYNLQYCLDPLSEEKRWQTALSWSNRNEDNNTYFIVPYDLTPQSLPFLEKKMYLRLTVKDENGLDVKNGEKVGLQSPNYLLLGRRAEPIIKITECDFTQNGDYSINVKVEDFGGNIGKYENFTRSVGNKPESSKEGTCDLTLFVSPDLKTLNHFLSVKRNISIKSPQLEGQGNYELSQIDSKGSTKFYFWANIKIYINEDNDYIEAQSNIATLYISGPTVSYRAHHLGINTQQDAMKEFDEDVLTVTDFENKRYIRLVGEYTDTDNTVLQKEITIDLKLGQIFGLEIDGGTWDEI